MTSPSIIQTRPATGKSFWPDSTIGDGHQPAAGSRDEFQRLRAAYRDVPFDVIAARQSWAEPRDW